MENITILVILFVLLVFAGLLVFSITSSRRAKEAKAQMAQTLGMTPVEPLPGALRRHLGRLRSRAAVS